MLKFLEGFLLTALVVILFIGAVVGSYWLMFNLGIWGVVIVLVGLCVAGGWLYSRQ